MKTLLSKPYFVIPLALAGILVNGALVIGGLSLVAKVFGPKPTAEVVKPEQAPTQVTTEVEPPEATTTPEPPTVTLQDALPVGYKAATLAQTAKTQEEWNAVAKQWLAAVEILEEVPKTSPDYPTAKAKRNEYLKNIEIANAKAQAVSPDTAPTSPLNMNTKELRWPDGFTYGAIPISFKKKHMDALVRLGKVDNDLVQSGVQIGVNAGNLVLMPPGTSARVLSDDGLISEVEISYALDSSGKPQSGKFWVLSMLVVSSSQ